jgi:hypothetical protein
MPRFQITQRRDAHQLYHATVEAEDAEHARQLAEKDECDWEEGEVVTYDDREIEVEEE